MCHFQQKTQLCTRSQAKAIYILFPDVQQQTDNSSCGLYALAYAYTLCEGKDPTRVAYSEANLRSHFLMCLRHHAIMSFSCGRALYHPGKPQSSKFKIYCSCRLPDPGDKIINCSKCKEWFHYACVDLDPDTKIRGSWLCITPFSQVEKFKYILCAKYHCGIICKHLFNV